MRGKEEHYLLPIGQCRPSLMVDLFEGLDHNMSDLMIQFIWTVSLYNGGGMTPAAAVYYNMSLTDLC